MVQYRFSVDTRYWTKYFPASYLDTTHKNAASPCPCPRVLKVVPSPIVSVAGKINSGFHPLAHFLSSKAPNNGNTCSMVPLTVMVAVFVTFSALKWTLFMVCALLSPAASSNDTMNKKVVFF